MKKSIFLVLIYLLVQNLASALLIGVVVLKNYMATGSLVTTDLSGELLAPLLVLGFVIMGVILWRMGYLRPGNEVWNITTPSYLGWTALLGCAMIFLIDVLLNFLDFLPNWLEESFDTTESVWLGIFAVSILGPILEEMLFRGAVTRELLARYTPTKAIIISGLIFGLFHINPAQVVPATISGFVLAWLYWRTKSIVPGIVIHIMNNSLSCFLHVTHPESESILDLMGNAPIAFCVLLALAFAYISVVKLSSVKKVDYQDTPLP